MEGKPPYYRRIDSDLQWAEPLPFKSRPKTPEYYDNKNGSLYKFSDDQQLNPWEFDIVKRVVRCRKKGQWREDLEKTKALIDLYLQEYDEQPEQGEITAAAIRGSDSSDGSSDERISSSDAAVQQRNEQTHRAVHRESEN